MSSKTIFIIAGEPSGDARAAELVRSLRTLDPSLNFEGLGGRDMESAGVQIHYPLASLAVIGFGDVLRKYFQIRKIFYDALRRVKTIKPACVILVDYPGFNLRFAKKINHFVPTYYYVSPQIWAWGKSRIHLIRRVIDHMLVLFEFEEKMYRKENVPATWVGHPLIEDVKGRASKTDVLHKLSLSAHNRYVGLLPGSRETEVRRILPVMLRAAEMIQEKIQGVSFVLSESDNVAPHVFDSCLSGVNRINLSRMRGNHRDVLTISDAAMVASGTATLETALFDVPFVILYKTAWSTYMIGRQVIKIPYIGLVNVAAGKKIVSEYIQGDARADKIADEIMSLLNDVRVRKAKLDAINDMKRSLGTPGAPKRAAQKIISLLQSAV